MVEIMAAAFTGGSFSRDASSFFSSEGPSPRVGQFLIAIDPGAGSSFFADRLEDLLGYLTQMDDVRLPGDRRLADRRHALEHGLNVPSRYLDIASALAGAYQPTG